MQRQRVKGSKWIYSMIVEHFLTKDIGVSPDGLVHSDGNALYCWGVSIARWLDGILHVRSLEECTKNNAVREVRAGLLASCQDKAANRRS